MAHTSDSDAAFVLEGRTVALTRGPDRAAAMLDALKVAGARGVLFPVLDFEVPADPGTLDRAVSRFASGGFDWLVVTSITTVRALAQRCAGMGLELANMVPEHTQVAAVGETTRRALEAEGITVDLLPASERSGQGLVNTWPQGEGVSVFLPQADIADPALAEGLCRRGADVVSVTAYCTVKYPADPHRRLDQPLSLTGPQRPESDVAVLTAEEFAVRQLDDGVDAVVLTSPSAARRVAEECGGLADSIKVVTIGRPTAREAGNCGFHVAAIAPEPSPQGIVAALKQAFGAAPESLSTDQDTD